MRAVRVYEFGDPDVLTVEDDVPVPEPPEGDVLIAVEEIGVGYGDVIVRSGAYPLPLPWIPGVEVGGRVVRLGPGVDASLLNRLVVATTAGQCGGYAEYAVAPAAWTFPLPDGLATGTALTVFQAGALAHGLLTAMHVRAHDTVLITAAAGRVGSLLVQEAKAMGCVVVGAAGGAKAGAVRDFGADHAVDYHDADWSDQVRARTGGRGPDVVLDGVGGAVAAQAMAAVADGGGRIGLYGYASGEWPALDAQAVIRRGLTVVGPLGIVLRKSEAEKHDDAEHALARAAEGTLRPRIHARLALERAAEAHRLLESRSTVGAVVLTV
jgi:NADPH2:quinone reductase